MSLAPRIEGRIAIRSSAAQFKEALCRRVEAGLLSGRPHPRSNYRVAHAGPEDLRIRAQGWWTAVNVGLNDVEVHLSRPGFVDFRVRYWRWSAFVIGLGSLLGIAGLVLLLAFDMRGYIAREPGARLPGLSIDQNLGILWGMVVFWGFVWPWVLIVLHKGPLRRLVKRLVAEVDADQEGLNC
jgi:hypothetical protein